MSAPTFAQAAPHYAAEWKSMKVQAPRVKDINGIAHLIFNNKARYLAVAKSLGLPNKAYAFIGCIHYREGGLNFHTHLHNGDPLTYRTTHVPAGRIPAPAQPPFTWEQSAEDALKLEGIEKIADWSIEHFAFTSEGYNGWGYYFRGATSPYDWAGTNQHAAGKFVADRVYNPNAIDAQEGVMPVLQELMLIDTTLDYVLEHP